MEEHLTRPKKKEEPIQQGKNRARLSTIFLYVSIFYNFIWLALFIIFFLKREPDSMNTCYDLIQWNFVLLLLCVICLFKHFFINFLLKVCELDMLNLLFTNMSLSSLVSIAALVILSMQIRFSYKEDFCQRIVIADIVFLVCESAFLLTFVVLVGIIVALKCIKK